MKGHRREVFLVPLLLTLALLLPTAVAGAAPLPQAAPASHLVMFRQGADPDAAAADLVRAHGLTVEFVYRHALNGASFVIPPAKVAAVQSDPRVALVEPNQRVYAFAETVPTGVNRIDAEAVAGPAGVNVAVLDTGIDLDHPDLYVVGSTNCARGGPFNTSCKNGEGDDGNGHGSHVAGIVAAKSNNGTGVRGVAPGAPLWAVKVLDNNGSGYVSWIVAGIDWVTARAATIKVANMSLGWQGASNTSLNTAISSSVAAGVTYVVAAGNSSTDAKDFNPANHPDVVAVSAVADSDGQCGALGAPTSWNYPDDSFAGWSNYGAVVDIAAPGVDIYSTYKNGGYATMSGTSMASPHVAGAAALYKAANSSASPADVRSALINGGIAQAAECSAGTGNGGFTGDKDSYPEPLVYVAVSGTSSPDLTPPAVPTGLTATAGDRRVDLNWDDNTESDLAGYNVYRSETSASGYAKIASPGKTSAYSDTGLTNGTAYYYRVTAVDTSGNESGASGEVSATPQVPIDSTPPSAPSGLSATAANGQVTLSWTASTDDTGVAGYNLYRRMSSGSYGADPVNGPTLVSGTSYLDTGLTNEITYYYVVTAVDTSGNQSASSGEASATPTAGSTSIAAAASYTTEGGRDGKAHLLTTVLITNGSSPVASATVHATVTNGSETMSYSGTTGSDGKVIFKWTNHKTGTYTTSVTRVVIGGITYENIPTTNQEYTK